MLSQQKATSFNSPLTHIMILFLKYGIFTAERKIARHTTI